MHYVCDYKIPQFRQRFTALSALVRSIDRISLATDIGEQCARSYPIIITITKHSTFLAVNVSMEIYSVRVFVLAVTAIITAGRVAGRVARRVARRVAGRVAWRVEQSPGEQYV